MATQLASESPQLILYITFNFSLSGGTTSQLSNTTVQLWATG